MPMAAAFSVCLTQMTGSPQSMPDRVATFPSMTGPVEVDAAPAVPDDDASVPCAAVDSSDLAVVLDWPPPEELTVLTALLRRPAFHVEGCCPGAAAFDRLARLLPGERGTPADDGDTTLEPGLRGTLGSRVFSAVGLSL